MECLQSDPQFNTQNEQGVARGSCLMLQSGGSEDVTSSLIKVTKDNNNGTILNFARIAE